MDLGVESCEDHLVMQNLQPLLLPPPPPPLPVFCYISPLICLYERPFLWKTHSNFSIFLYLTSN